MPSNTVEQQLIELEKEYWRAIRDRDTKAALRLTDDTCVVAGSQGVASLDQQSFSKRGVPSTLILWSDYILHVTADTVEKVDLGHLQRAGDVVSQVALELARGEGP